MCCEFVSSGHYYLTFPHTLDLPLLIFHVRWFRVGAAVGPLVAGFVSNMGWQYVFYMLMTADVLALLVRIYMLLFMTISFPCWSPFKGVLYVPVAW